MQKNNLMQATIVFVAVIVLVVGTIFYQNNSKTSRTSVTEDSKPPESSATQTTAYKDGTYSADGTYLTPDNEEVIGITLTIKDNFITSAEAQEKGVLATSKNFQEEFIGSFKPMVIGKNISDLKLGKVAGSSLTPKGFNDALSKIKEQAKV